MIFTLAKEGGFTEKQVLEELPIYRVNCYYHAALRSHDVWTVPPFAAADDQIEKLMEFASIDNGEDEDE